MDNVRIPRIGIYGSVAQGSEVFNVITSILGYDPFEVKEIEVDSVISPYCGRAKTFGAHFTIYDIFTPTDIDKVVETVRNILKNYQPFSFVFSGFKGYVRGDYQGKSVYSTTAKTVLALDFDEESIKKFQEIHKDIVTNIQLFRKGIEPEFSKDIFKNVPELWNLIEKYGAPYVLQNYSPHMTLASSLDGTDDLCDKLTKYLNEKYGEKLLNIPILFDHVYIFQEIIEGQYSGYFKVINKIKLG